MDAINVLAAIEAAGGEVVIADGRAELRAPAALPPELVAEARANRAELLALLLTQDAGLELDNTSPLVNAARELAPVVRVTIREAGDVAAYVALLRRIRLIAEEFPGANLLELRIVALDGRVGRPNWSVYACPELRRALGRVLADAARDRNLDPVSDQ
ncbi:MAG: hypothetical protein U0446_11760 [Dehalococcoidia bacterium]